MFAVYAARIDPQDPLRGLVVGERPEPEVPVGWVPIRVRAASVNHHDLWSLKGVGLPAERLPMILGCDAAGIDPQGREVVVHSVISSGDFADETLDPRRSLLSEVHQGTFADVVVVPVRNVLPKPASLTMAEAACLPTAWLTAYRMLVTRSSLKAGDTVLVQGAGGGVATAAIMLARAIGLRVWVTSRSPAKIRSALEIGAHEGFESGARLPDRVDAVIESVGAATWSHSLKSLKPGGEIIVTGATSGPNPPADLQRVFFKQLSVIGSTMGTRDELRRLLALCAHTGLRPPIERELPMERAGDALADVARGEVFGKIVLTRP
jgi:NADPH:quinone reductase-like Zn-dependent oxidoreductase